MIILLCGYTKSGKDTFYQSLLDGTLSQKFILSPPVEIKLPVERFSLADKVKENVHQAYQLAHPRHYEQVKDSYRLNDGKTLRQAYIDYAIQMKELHGKNYWCQQFHYDPDKTYIITDFRFRHEYKYFKKLTDDLITIRIFRQIPIPASTITTEHDLDNFKTDYLAVSQPEEFKLALELFPQYRS